MDKVDMHISCGKCRETLPLESFMPSQRKAGKWCRSCMRTWYIERSGGLVDRACDHCGIVREVTGRRASESKFYCSRKCKERARRDAEIADRLAVKQAQPPRVCPHCGDTLAVNARTDAVFCSAECNSAAHGLKRANGRLSRGSGRRRDVQRAYIIERDRSTCYLCGKVCESREIHIDHVIAVSDGGSNTADNRAVSCGPCNLKKGARPVTVQLMLVG